MYTYTDLVCSVRSILEVLACLISRYWEAVNSEPLAGDHQLDILSSSVVKLFVIMLIRA